MKTKPYVGQHVRLNDYALRSSGIKLQSRQEFKDSEDMIVTHVENIGSANNPIWVIDVNKPAINKFLLDWTMVDPLVTTGYAAIYAGDTKIYERGTPTRGYGRADGPVEHAAEYDSDMD